MPQMESTQPTVAGEISCHLPAPCWLDSLKLSMRCHSPTYIQMLTSNLLTKDLIFKQAIDCSTLHFQIRFYDLEMTEMTEMTL